ncbi:MAG: tRNA uridine-5-carboxymethylaminomethyl(34) synthesis GTPase MnmE [Deltaproteobacteria bacterium RIFCSPLOWO2_02_FULL_50_16]|nr:MAG: tRNA uridine-5-carboxymethylaminomethyl(34) synthesis GTPase MnmE [Deltaproteobacteria bacterium RIFCSPHIGHO2_02_FULL_50_15]OGQ56822.1 MAG: tRNA uridine-5-carboxymethylaminomethyl(34) synthesis GTPase MnmE [Deltaproteobacteria bacterium RIFCSPLOWO2_02_FULL_50_16]OGQ68273.1 MAG: tRNA uridine-5-carboxymethylaminomethyl(34) synthesis GTPase MnmE [Deltaproteobacteria bacterium RIFCSPLOWO2_12_FULL_50_11]
MKASEIETIVALATPLGPSGIGIVRMSGPQSPSILAGLWEGALPCARFETHRLYKGVLKAPNLDRHLDHIMACWMKAPQSYTGEDVVEIHAHGGPLLLEKILGALVTQGARLALPGEFTQRAFVNGKIDLVQAEAIADLIMGQNEETLKVAERQLSGALSQHIQILRDRLLQICVALEGDIDFVEEEDISAIDRKVLKNQLDQALHSVDQWLKTYQEGRLWREGIQCPIIGRPNVGKSSLLNALLNQDRALVHDRPGTTRDTVEETLLLEGLPVRLIDTAGLYSSTDSIEIAGQERSRSKIRAGDLCLWVVDGSEPLSKEDRALYDFLQERSFLLVINKADKGLKVDVEALETSFHPVGCPVISALRGQGILDLRKSIKKWAIHEGRALDADVVINKQRHFEALSRCHQFLQGAKEGLLQGLPQELVADDMALAVKALREITGEITTDEVLGEIFSRFCVGK